MNTHVDRREVAVGLGNGSDWDCPVDVERAIGGLRLYLCGLAGCLSGLGGPCAVVVFCLLIVVVSVVVLGVAAEVCWPPGIALAVELRGGGVRA